MRWCRLSRTPATRWCRILALPANKPPASEAEIQLIQSRLVLGKTVHDLGLDISVTKNTFPIFGAGWDRLTGHSNDTVKVTDFVLPKGSADQTFTLTVLGAEAVSADQRRRLQRAR